MIKHSHLAKSSSIIALFFFFITCAQETRGQDKQPLPYGDPVTSNKNANTNTKDSTEVDYTRVFNPRETTRKARILSKPQPAYTEEARENEVEGTIILKAVLASSGNVTNIRVVKGLPYGLTETVIEFARQLKFIPAEKDGHQVSQYIQIEYNFHLDIDEDSPKIKIKPVILDKPAPVYTEEARAHGTKGKVILEVELSPIWGVSVEKVIQGLPYGLTESAVEAAKQIKFEPAITKKDHPLSVMKKIEYEFKP